MTTLTIVIRLTGLLLLTPESYNPIDRQYYLPLNVLMPQTPGPVQIARHIPEIVFSSTSQECPTKMDHLKLDQYWRAGYCHVNIDGWSVDIGTPSTPTIFAETVPQANLSRFFGVPLKRSLFTEVPGTQGGAIASHVNIYGGSQSGKCLFGTFTIGSSSPVPLINVVEWTTSVQSATFPLVRRRTKAGVEEREELTTLRAGKSTVYVRNAPEPTYLSELPIGIARRMRSSTMAAVHARPHPVNHQYTVDHYRAFFHLLNVTADPPQLHQQSNERCPWDPDVSRKALRKDDPGTQTCMVGVGLPPRP
jgi:hypothetical protein